MAAPCGPAQRADPDRPLGGSRPVPSGGGRRAARPERHPVEALDRLGRLPRPHLGDLLGLGSRLPDRERHRHPRRHPLRGVSAAPADQPRAQHRDLRAAPDRHRAHPRAHALRHGPADRAGGARRLFRDHERHRRRAQPVRHARRRPRARLRGRPMAGPAARAAAGRAAGDPRSARSSRSSGAAGAGGSGPTSSGPSDGRSRTASGGSA